MLKVKSYKIDFDNHCDFNLIDSLRLLKRINDNKYYNIECHLLRPVYNNCKSYYNKAEFKKYVISESEEHLQLYSYGKNVCKILKIKEDDEYDISIIIDISLLSQTTKRHLEEFLFQFAGVEDVVYIFRDKLKEFRKKNK